MLGVALAAPAKAVDVAAAARQLKAHYAATADDSESSNAMVRVWSLLEVAPATSGINAVYVPAAHTRGSPQGPSRIIVLPRAFYYRSLPTLLGRQLSFRLTNPAPAAQACGGSAADVTDCCVSSPALACMEDDRLFADPATLAPAALYSLTAMDFLAIELAPAVRSFSVAELEGSALDSDTLYLAIGADTEHPGRLLLARVDADLLVKLTIAIRHLDRQLAKRADSSPRLTGSLDCSNGRWQSVEDVGSPDARWLGDQASTRFRGESRSRFEWVGLRPGTNSLVVVGREASSAPLVETLAKYVGGPTGAGELALCLGPEVDANIRAIPGGIGELQSPALSAAFVHWLELLGTLEVLTQSH